MNRRLDGIGNFESQERNGMKHVALIIAFLSVSATCTAAVSDQQAIERAKHFASELGSEFRDSTANVQRNPENGRIMISDGHIFVGLSDDGKFVSFTGRMLDPSRGSNRFRNEEEAWAFAGELVAKLEPPAHLERRRFDRLPGTTKRMRFVFNQKPYGFWASGGNSATIILRESDGGVLTAVLSRDWTFEPPNLMVTENEARQTASGVFEIEPAQWLVELEYKVGASDDEPQYMREMAAARQARLCYNLSGVHGEKPVAVVIDSVTGAIVWQGTGGLHPHASQFAERMGDLDKIRTSAGPVSTDLIAPRESIESVSDESVPLWMICVGIAVAAAVIGVTIYFRQRAKTELTEHTMD
jgi:hypothetical protein